MRWGDPPLKQAILSAKGWTTWYAFSVEIYVLLFSKRCRQKLVFDQHSNQ